MGIAKDQVIKRDELIDYHAVAGFQYINQASAEGVVLGGRGENKEGYFWIRNTPELYQTPAYFFGTTYAKNYRVLDNSIVYQSLVDGNNGNTPASSPTFWKEMPDSPQEDTYINVRVNSTIRGTFNSDDDYYHLKIWEVTWDVNEDEELNLVYDNKQDLPDSSINIRYDPGYYKYWIRASSQGGSSRTITTIYARRFANDFSAGDKIRVFSSDYKELLPQHTTLVTADIAKAGRLSSENYVGGDYEVHVP